MEWAAHGAVPSFVHNWGHPPSSIQPSQPLRRSRRLWRDGPTRLQFTDLFRFPPAFIKFRHGKLSPRRGMNYSFS